MEGFVGLLLIIGWMLAILFFLAFIRTALHLGRMNEALEDCVDALENAECQTLPEPRQSICLRAMAQGRALIGPEDEG